MYQQCCRSTDSLLRTDGALFSTLDQDNDGTQAKVCTSEYHSGWWHSWNAFCTEANMNGIYYPMYKSDKTGIFWFNHYEYFTLKEVRMMLRNPWYYWFLDFNLQAIEHAILSQRCFANVIVKWNFIELFYLMYLY